MRVVYAACGCAAEWAHGPSQAAFLTQWAYILSGTATGARCQSMSRTGGGCTTFACMRSTLQRCTIWWCHILKTAALTRAHAVCTLSAGSCSSGFICWRTHIRFESWRQRLGSRTPAFPCAASIITSTPCAEVHSDAGEQKVRFLRDEAALKAIAAEFEKKYQLRGCVGPIDGTAISMRKLSRHSVGGDSNLVLSGATRAPLQSCCWPE